MASKLTLKNLENTEFSITHNDGDSAITVSSDELSKVKTIDTIADLKSISNPPPTVWVSGYYTKGDGAFGSNIFEWESASTDADNGGTIIKLGSVVTGRYKLRYSGAVSVKWFGAKGDGVTDDTVAIQNAIGTNINVYVPEGEFLITSTLNMTAPGLNSLVGESKSKSKLVRDGDFVTLSVGSSGNSRRMYVANLWFNIYGASPAVSIDFFLYSTIERIHIQYDVLPTTVSDESIGIEIRNSWHTIISEISTELGTAFRAEETQNSIGIAYTYNTSGIVTQNCTFGDVRKAFVIRTSPLAGEAASAPMLGFRFNNCSHEGGSEYSTLSTSFIIEADSGSLQGLIIEGFKGEIVDTFIDTTAATGYVYGLYVRNSFFKGEYSDYTYKMSKVVGFSLFDTNNISQPSASGYCLFSACTPEIGTTNQITKANLTKTVELIGKLNDTNNVTLNGTANTWNSIAIAGSMLASGLYNVGNPTMAAVFIRYFRSGASTTLKFRLSQNTTIEVDVSGDYGSGATWLYVPLSTYDGRFGTLQYYSSSTGCKIYEVQTYATH